MQLKITNFTFTFRKLDQSLRMRYLRPATKTPIPAQPGSRGVALANGKPDAPQLFLLYRTAAGVYAPSTKQVSHIHIHIHDERKPRCTGVCGTEIPYGGWLAMPSVAFATISNKETDSVDGVCHSPTGRRPRRLLYKGDKRQLRLHYY